MCNTMKFNDHELVLLVLASFVMLLLAPFLLKGVSLLCICGGLMLLCCPLPGTSLAGLPMLLIGLILWVLLAIFT